MTALNTNGWQPIETAPRDDGDSLLVSDGKDVMEAYWDSSVSQWCNVYDYIYITPTHWQPLPPPPTEAV